MPLILIELRKPNNHDGIIAERQRINTRFHNNKFRLFINITQFMLFSNNVEYDSESIVPIQGAFYAIPSLSEVGFNCFREENTEVFTVSNEINEAYEPHNRFAAFPRPSENASQIWDCVCRRQ
jgi:type I restriction enzyme R subunit